MLFLENLTGNSSCDTSKFLFCPFHPQKTERKTIKTGSLPSKKREKQYKYTHSSQRDIDPPTDTDLLRDRPKNSNTITTQDTIYVKKRTERQPPIQRHIHSDTDTDIHRHRQSNRISLTITIFYINDAITKYDSISQQSWHKKQ